MFYSGGVSGGGGGSGLDSVGIHTLARVVVMSLVVIDISCSSGHGGCFIHTV